MLEEKGLVEFTGKAAIASAKTAYGLYRTIFSGERWEKLAAAGAKPQRLLWASTGNKNPETKDTVYVEELIGPDTVNTVPLSTIDAFKDHGLPANRLEQQPEHALAILEKRRLELIWKKCLCNWKRRG
ncbi:transaldolase family protein [Mucilaginibacter achroorhodeus]|uniref:transaldolase family protein n=1 Tax=Mucilaginibacter achroorhodeus TaxID=2599294 RepID=UPI0021BD7976|nr:transaldolase family protein [Mucilaginibacter achroorhodeus]